MIKPRLLFFAACVLSFPRAGWSQVIVIVNSQVKSASISKLEVRELFSGEVSSLKDGSRVSPVLLRPGPTEDEFVAMYFGKSDSAFRAAWRSLVFSGQAAMPKSLESEKALVDYVSHTPSSIGFINKKTLHDGVKVLDVR